MPTPIAHSLAGMIFGILKFLPDGIGFKSACRTIWQKKWIFLLCIVLANAPDIDYVFGIFSGNWNKFHQMATHSFLFILVVSSVIYFVLKKRRIEKDHFSFIFIFLLMLSHIVMDFFGRDTSFPIGLPLLFPFSCNYFHSSLEIFPAVRKKTLADLFDMHNMRVILFEILLIVPFLFLALIMKKYCKEQYDGKAKC